MINKNRLIEIANYFRLSPDIIMGNMEDYQELYDNRFEDIFDDDRYIDGMEGS